MPENVSSPIVDQMQQRYEKLKPEQQDKVSRFLTPQVAATLGVLLGDEVGNFVKQIGRMDLQSLPVPKQAMTFLGEEKVQKFFESAMIKAQEMQEPVAQAGGQPQGLASPQQAPQQAPVSTPAPTGLASPQQGRPQLPLPASSNATAVDNQPIQ